MNVCVFVVAGGVHSTGFADINNTRMYLNTFHVSLNAKHLVVAVRRGTLITSTGIYHDSKIAVLNT